MKYKIGIVLFVAISLCVFPSVGSHEQLTEKKESVAEVKADDPLPKPNDEVRAFLESKNSPLAPHTDFLLQQEHWKLLIAISAIESQYCTRQLGNNCWGIGGDSNYQKYGSVEDAILSANGLITRWQAKGRWLTVEDFNCHYVVPCNQNWVNVVNQVLEKINAIENKQLQMRTEDME